MHRLRRSPPYFAICLSFSLKDTAAMATAAKSLEQEATASPPNITAEVAGSCFMAATLAAGSAASFPTCALPKGLDFSKCLFNLIFRWLQPLGLNVCPVCFDRRLRRQCPWVSGQTNALWGTARLGCFSNRTQERPTTEFSHLTSATAYLGPDIELISEKAPLYFSQLFPSTGPV